MADRMISQVKLYYEQIKEKFDEMETVTLNLQVDPQIQCILAQGSDIGKVICRKESESLPISRTEKPLKECLVEMDDFVEVKGHDGNISWCSGVAYLPGGQVMLADSNNKRLLLLNSSYKCNASFTLPDQPYDICVVDLEDVSVSIPNLNTLQFLSVTSGTMKATRKVQTIYKCQGVALAGKGEIIVSGPCGKGKYYWSLITSAGEEKCHQFSCQCNTSDCDVFYCQCHTSESYVALNSSCTRVYMTVCYACSLYCFDLDGRMMYKYSPDSLKWPEGVATDRDDNVYVVGYTNNDIHQLTSDCTLIRIVTKGIPSCPRAICFNNNRDKFLITNMHRDEVGKLYMYRFK